MINEHFLVSLERTPARRWTWIGVHSVYDFPFDRTTLFAAVDFLEYPTNGELWEFLVNAGIDFARQGLENKTVAAQPLKSGALAVFASKFVLFKEIANMSDGWYAVWSDDTVLTVPYRTFEQVIQRSQGFEIIVPFVPLNRHFPDIWLNKKFVDGQPEFYDGFIGAGETMFVLRPSGAQQLLDVQAQYFDTWLDVLGGYNNDLFHNVATFVHPYIREHISISGIRTTKEPVGDGILRVPIFKRSMHASEKRYDNQY